MTCNCRGPTPRIPLVACSKIPTAFLQGKSPLAYDCTYTQRGDQAAAGKTLHAVIVPRTCIYDADTSSLELRASGLGFYCCVSGCAWTFARSDFAPASDSRGLITVVSRDVNHDWLVFNPSIQGSAVIWPPTLHGGECVLQRL